MIEARAFVGSFDKTKKILADQGAVFKGEYRLQDAIYASKDPTQGIDQVFLRLRHISKNIWHEKPFIVAIKHTELKQVGKQSIIPVRKEFDTKVEALAFIKENYSDQFAFLFEFSRTGWQYDLGNDQVDLEDVEGFLSVEYKSRTEEGLKKLLELFDENKVIKGPSVVTVKELLKR